MNTYTTHTQEGPMSARLHIILSKDLNAEVERVVEEAETNRSEIIRKALHLYIAAHDAKRKGLKLCLVNAETEKVETQIIGL